ncbi:MAG: ATP-dependent sacrificial sulfur transferase LarE [Clostridia bacterium]|nr:ATP-dependent sacrificial sulfur transferase LarE [Clostridia bacterium]
MNTGEKYDKLLGILRAYGRCAVAFSGGADSSLLLRCAADALGARNVLAVTARADVFPERENEEAKCFCSGLGVKQVFTDRDLYSVDGFCANPPDRCYICKRAIFGGIIEAAGREGFDAVLEGSNTDDLGDYRPGMRAIEELGVKSPLIAAGLSKTDVHSISAALGLPTADKPSFACLATRFVYGEPLTPGRIRAVGKAEQLLYDLGFHRVRVRVHGTVSPSARIEIDPAEFPLMLEGETRKKVAGALYALGYAYVSLDLSGYRTGSMNAPILGGKPEQK